MSPLHITVTVEVNLILVDLSIYLILGSLGHVGSGHEVLYVLTVTGDFGNLLAAEGESRSHKEVVFRPERIDIGLEIEYRTC